MNQNNPLQNNTTGLNNYPQPPTNMIQMEQSDYSDYLFTNVISDSYATSNYGQQQFEQSEQSAFSFVNNEDSTSTTQSSYYAPQYANRGTPSLNTNFSQSNNSEIFRFEIPGFKIIVIPTSSPFANLTNLDMQNQFQQDYSY